MNWGQETSDCLYSFQASHIFKEIYNLLCSCLHQIRDVVLFDTRNEFKLLYDVGIRLKPRIRKQNVTFLEDKSLPRLRVRNFKCECPFDLAQPAE